VHPLDQRKGYGTELFRFAAGKMHVRPILVKATLNAAPFYAKLGCRKVRTESIRRHDHDIYVERWSWSRHGMTECSRGGCEDILGGGMVV
jgi:hypothetical protein